MTLDQWVLDHPFLEGIARLLARIDKAAKSVAVPSLCFPDWDGYRDDFAAGVPLLASTAAAMDVSPVDEAVPRVLHALRGDTGATETKGLHQYLRWHLLSSALQQIARAFDAWRDDERWRHPRCPTCGSLPAMAQLVGVDPGRRRLLSCGHCGTRWQYGRTICPFCDAQSHRLTGLALEGQGGLRLDYCESCRGYLKTYDGHGDETVMLADWTSLHLDALANDRGLIRRAASLYELEQAHHERVTPS
jgi:FdhE protein